MEIRSWNNENGNVAKRQKWQIEIDVTKTENGEKGTMHGYWKMKKWEQSRDLEVKLLIGLGL